MTRYTTHACSRCRRPLAVALYENQHDAARDQDLCDVCLHAGLDEPETVRSIRAYRTGCLQTRSEGAALRSHPPRRKP